MAYRLPETKIILASASSTRRTMFEKAGLEVEFMPAAVDEESLKEAGRAEGMNGRDTATLIAEMKARKISDMAPDAFVIGSDQLLVCGDDWLSKPTTLDEAHQSLRLLSGKIHELVTAAVIYQHGKRIWHHIEAPKISIRTLDDDDISAYLSAMGSTALLTPGVYMMEGLGAQIITKVDGCPYAVLGLPLLQLLSFLRVHGLTRHEDEQ